MADAETPITTVLDTLPVPAFLAQHNGSLLYANESMGTVSGQPDLVGRDRTLFGLGLFNNPAELRGFIGSFRHGGKSRRLVVPSGRLRKSDQSLILFATLIDFQDRPALCGVLTKSKLPPDLIRGRTDGGEDALLDRLDCFVIRIDLSGQPLSINLPLLIELGLDRSADALPHWLKIDAELDKKRLRTLQRKSLNHGSAGFETSLQRQNGSLIPIEAVMKPLRRVEYKDQFLITAYDISDRRREQRERQDLVLEVEKLRVQLARRSALVSEKFNNDENYKIVSASPAYDKILHQIKLVAPTESTVLITGETGTGKELIARSVHGQSSRANRPLLILNCGALPAELIESELFGYRKGAFTGARTDHLGRFELADEGTLFLDEIGEMPMLLQTRLLRVLQDGEFTPLGAKESLHSDVRIIAATNRNLRDQVAAGTFRADLYFRLNIFPIHSIPLRERREDIAPLAQHFIKKYTPRGVPTPTIRPADLKRLQEYPFEGNVRELENIIQRALIVSTGPHLQLQLDYSQAGSGAAVGTSVSDTMKEPEILDFVEIQRQHILRVLRMTEGKVSGSGGAAELLGLNAQTLFSKMRKLGISRKKEVYS